MNWFTENPTPVLLIGGTLLLILGAMVWKTGRGSLLLAMAAVAGVLIAAVVTDYLVVTERERVINVIYDGARALESNDVEQIRPLLTPQAQEVLRQAKAVLDIVVIEKVTITGTPQVTFNRLLNPPGATASFTAVAQGKFRYGETVRDKIPQHVDLQFRLIDGKWLIDEAKHSGLQGEN